MFATYDNQYHIRQVEIDSRESVKPLLLYQGSFGPSLAAAFAFRGRGSYYLDDIDNIGVLRGESSVDPGFGVAKKFLFNKKGWTNCRPLFFTFPEHILGPNLSFARFSDLNEIVPVKEISKSYHLSIDKWIRGQSQKYGSHCIYGPNRAMVSIQMKEVGSSIESAFAAMRESLRRFFVSPGDFRNADDRLQFILGTPSDFDTLNKYSQATLERVCKKLFSVDLKVRSFAKDFLYHRRLSGLQLYQEDPNGYRDRYNRCARIQGSSELQEGDLPFYRVNIKTGLRHLKDQSSLIPSDEEVVAPKVLALEGLENLIYPLGVMNRSSIVARELSFYDLNTGSSQVFYRANWLEALGGNAELVRLDSISEEEFGYSEMSMGDWAIALLTLSDRFSEQLNQISELRNLGSCWDISLKKVGLALDAFWRKWILYESVQAMETVQFPVLFYTLGGEQWVDSFRVTEMRRYQLERR